MGYTGHGQSDDSGLLYARARWIDPVSGRFLSSDPVLFNSGGYNHFNRYAYTYNNPYTMVDPDGEHPVVEGAVVAVVVGIVGRYLVNKVFRKHVSNKVRKKVAQELSKKKIAKEASEEVTKSSRKRVKRLVKNLSDNSRQNNGLSQEKTDQLRRIVEKTGGKLRSDGASGVKGSSAGKPHVQTEGLGKSIDSRHIWTKEGVQ